MTRLPLLSLFAATATVSALTYEIVGIPQGIAVGSNFTGLSVEFFGIADLFLANSNIADPLPSQYTTEIPKRVNYHVLQLLANLAAPTGSPVLIRVGGNSANRVTLQGSTLPPLPLQFASGAQDVLSLYDLQLLDFVAATTGIKYTLAIGMPTSTPVYAQQWIDAFKTNVDIAKHVVAIELGNEPDHFVQRGWRTATYGYADFVVEYQAYAAVILASLGPSTVLMGPSFAFEWSLDGNILDFINKTSQLQTKISSFHRYGVNGCNSRSTLDNLLDSPGPIEYQFVSDISTLAAQKNILNVWSEGGSASCKGVLGISDVFGSALWTVDIMFEMAARGVSNAFMSGSPQAIYAPLSIENGNLNPRPSFYAMLLFNIAVGPGNSVIYRAGVQALRLKAWGAYDSVLNSHTIVVVHKSNATGEACVVNIPGATGQGQLITLTAASITASTRFSIAGMTFDGSLDGMPLGSYNETLIDSQNGVYSFTAISGSVTLLRVFMNANVTLPLPPLVQFVNQNYPVVVINAGSGTRKPPGAASSAPALLASIWLAALLIAIL